MRIITSTSAAARLDAARAFVTGRPPSTELIIVGASRGAADDLARTMARQSGATFGITRFGLTELAARAAAARLDGERRMPGTQAGAEAMAARAVFDALADHELAYFEPVARMPGFPKALARTLHELRLAGVSLAAGPKGPALDLRESGPGPSGPGEGAADLAALLARVEAELARSGVDDRAALFHLAADACRAGDVRWARQPILLLDVPLDSRAEQAFVAALLAQSPDVLATVPDGDQFALDALKVCGGMVEEPASYFGPRTSDLECLRRYVFQTERPVERERTGDVVLFSAPGEAREAVEIVRRVLDEAARGVPFDEMAVFLRTPQQYLGLLEHACARGDVPVYFDRGTRRPDPAGRAFIALLSCAVDGLSAKRFDEYLSLGQVPQVSDTAAAAALVTPLDEVFADEERRNGPLSPADVWADPVGPPDPKIDTDDDAIVAGTLRSPWKWEELIVESAVVGGRTREDGQARWRRRLDGLAADFKYRIAELKKDEPESARDRKSVV